MPNEPDPQNLTPPANPGANPDPAPTPPPDPSSLLDTPPAGDPAPTDTPPGTPADPEGDPPTEPSSLLDDDGEPTPFGADPVTAEQATAMELPDGVELNAEQLQPFLDLVNNANSRADIVQGSLNMIAEQQNVAETAISEEWSATQNAWRDEVKADPTHGGEHFEKSLATARTVIETHAEDAKSLKELFTLTGMGNNIHMVRFLNAIAAATPGEAPPVSGNPAPVPASRAEKLFGT